jgi:two-component system chemotaxis response regulator CheV
MEKDALFCGATSDIEILEFRAGGNSYGVNINDIREILPYNLKPTPMPNTHPFLEGMIMPRDFIIPIINLSASFLLNKAAVNKSNNDYDKNKDNNTNDSFVKKDDMLVVTSINNLNIAFHVDSVSGIHRINASIIEKPGKKLTTQQKDVIIGIFKTEDRKIEIVDLRQIIKIINTNVIVN